MANDLNYCSFIGRLGADPETRHTPNGNAVTNIRLAVGESWKDKTTGEKQEKTEWVRITCYGKLAEICGQYLTKGSQAFFSGRMSTRKWTDKEGNDRYSTEIIADRMQMLGGGERQSGSSGGTGKSSEPSYDEFNDDIPF